MYPKLLAVALLAFSTWATAAPTVMRDAVGLTQRDDVGVGKVYDIPGSGRRVKKEEGAVDDLPGPAKLQEFTLPTSGSHPKGKADHELDIPGAGK